MNEKPEALKIADAMLLQIEENIALRRENERLREALTYDWDQLEACRESLREHMVEINRLRELLTEARGAKWLVVQDNLLDRIDAALRREPGDG